MFFRRLAGIVAGGVLAAAAASPVEAGPLTKAERAEAVEAIAKAFADTYVFENRAHAVAEGLRSDLTKGAFDSASSREALARQLTSAMRAIESDKHIEVTVGETESGADERPRAERYAWIDRLRRRNYDFARVEILPGNVGYLKLDSFPPPELAGPTAKAAMEFLKNSDAVIIDLRDNGGGTGDMVRLLASYFFVEQTALLRTFRRADDPQITTDYTLTMMDGARVPIIDLYVIVGGNTFSAAEAFAFALQQRERATIVGETTRGGANAGRYVDVEGFRVFIPVAHAMAANSDASWEGVGVKPDIASSAADALRAAHRDALRRLTRSLPEGPARERAAKALHELN